MLKEYENSMPFQIEKLKWDADGLIPAVVQDDKGEVLMVAYMNNVALNETIESGFGTYYSRSRQKLWRKGEESGNRQKILEIRIDCDLDCIVLKVIQTGGACHTGYYSCFYREIKDGEITITEEPIFDADSAYKK